MKNLIIYKDDLDWLIRYLSIYNISKAKAYSLIEEISFQLASSVKSNLSREDSLEFLLGHMRIEVQRIKDVQSRKRLQVFRNNHLEKI